MTNETTQEKKSPMTLSAKQSFGVNCVRAEFNVPALFELHHLAMELDWMGSMFGYTHDDSRDCVTFKGEQIDKAAITLRNTFILVDKILAEAGLSGVTSESIFTPSEAQQARGLK